MAEKSAKLEYLGWPLGACPECLRQWRDHGLPSQRQELEAGAFVLSGYCSHREAGFYTVVSADWIVREWCIRVPIAIEEWQAYVRILPRNIMAVKAACRDAAGEASPSAS
jgi:hypothetical protein